MRKLMIFLALLLLMSCNYFEAKKISSETILKEELQTFNWNDVDEYPSLASCNSSGSKQEKQTCFRNTISTHIYKSLDEERLSVTQDIQDTILIKFVISEKGYIDVSEFKIDSLTIEELPNIEQLIMSSIRALPKIYPALKRGQQVKTAFKLPIIISVN